LDSRAAGPCQLRLAGPPGGYQHGRAARGAVAGAVRLPAAAPDLAARLARAPRPRAAQCRAQAPAGLSGPQPGHAGGGGGGCGEAKRQAKIANNLLNDPPLTLLLAAQTAQLGGDEDAARRYFTAMLEKPETAFLGLRGLLMQAMKAGDRAEA